MEDRELTLAQIRVAVVTVRRVFEHAERLKNGAVDRLTDGRSEVARVDVLDDECFCSSAEGGLDDRRIFNRREDCNTNVRVPLAESFEDRETVQSGHQD